MHFWQKPRQDKSHQWSIRPAHIPAGSEYFEKWERTYYMCKNSKIIITTGCDSWLWLAVWIKRYWEIDADKKMGRRRSFFRWLCGEHKAIKPLFSVSPFRLDPPGPARIGGHYFHTGCPYVRHKNNKNTLLRLKHDTTLHGAWWVTLKSPFLFFLSSPPFLCSLSTTQSMGKGLNTFLLPTSFYLWGCKGDNKSSKFSDPPGSNLSILASFWGCFF